MSKNRKWFIQRSACSIFKVLVQDTIEDCFFFHVRVIGVLHHTLFELQLPHQRVLLLAFWKLVIVSMSSLLNHPWKPSVSASHKSALVLLFPQVYGAAVPGTWKTGTASQLQLKHLFPQLIFVLHKAHHLISQTLIGFFEELLVPVFLGQKLKELGDVGLLLFCIWLQFLGDWLQIGHYVFLMFFGLSREAKVQADFLYFLFQQKYFVLKLEFHLAVFSFFFLSFLSYLFGPFLLLL